MRILCRKLKFLVFLGPIYGIFEAMQVTNVVFVLAKYFGGKIDADREWYKQWATWGGIILSGTSIYLLVTGLWGISSENQTSV